MTDPEHDPDSRFVETAATSSPRFDEAVPHAATPGGEIYFWGTVARRVGPRVIRIGILGAIIAVAVALTVEVL